MHNLMGHMHLHSDSKPFKCLYCPSKFTLKGNLTRHMKVKHGVMERGLHSQGNHPSRKLLIDEPTGHHVGVGQGMTARLLLEQTVLVQEESAMFKISRGQQEQLMSLKVHIAAL